LGAGEEIEDVRTKSEEQKLNFIPRDYPKRYLGSSQ
jgi:hypothetical protein